VQDVLRDLNMRPRQIVDSRLLPVDDTLHVPSNGYPLQEKAPSFFEDPGRWWKQRFGRRSMNQSSESTKLEVAWKELPNGQRERVFCLICQEENKPWRTPEPCSHVLNATGQAMQPMSTGYAMDVASVSIPGGTAGANTVTEPASNKPIESVEQEQDPAWQDIKSIDDEYALPCGHIHGAAWNRDLESWACSVCNAPFKLEDLSRKSE
jgi:hypothetical protein